MEPKLPTPSRGPELPSVTPEMAGNFSTPETQIGASVERGEGKSEAVTQSSQSATPITPTLPLAVVTSPLTDDSAVPLQTNISPAAAKDNELIEREWVDKAKKVIIETKDDPYQREQRVSELQADYLWKRYGRQLKAPQ